MNLSKSLVESNVLLGPNLHANGDAEELTAVEESIFKNAELQAEIAKLKLPEGTVVMADPWIYGSSSPFSSPLLFTYYLRRRPKDGKMATSY